MTLAEAERLLRTQRDPRRRPFSATEWSPDPAFTHEEARIWEAARQRKWISSLSERDWERISALVDQTTSAYQPAALEDLDAGFRVGTILPNSAGGTSGRRFGTLRGVVLVAFPPDRDIQPKGKRHD